MQFYYIIKNRNKDLIKHRFFCDRIYFTVSVYSVFLQNLSLCCRCHLFQLKSILGPLERFITNLNLVRTFKNGSKRPLNDEYCPNVCFKGTTAVENFEKRLLCLSFPLKHFVLKNIKVFPKRQLKVVS